MENQTCKVLLVCCIQVTPESVDVYMKPPKTAAASFCILIYFSRDFGITWEAG